MLDFCRWQGHAGFCAGIRWRGPWCHIPLKTFANTCPRWMCALWRCFRENQPVCRGGVTPPFNRVMRCFGLSATEHVRTVMAELRRMSKPVTKVMIAGGGNIGLRLAKKPGRKLPGEGDRCRSQALRGIGQPVGLAHLGVCTAMPPMKTCWRKENVQDVDTFIAFDQ